MYTLQLKASPWKNVQLVDGASNCTRVSSFHSLYIYTGDKEVWPVRWSMHPSMCIGHHDIIMTHIYPENRIIPRRGFGQFWPHNISICIYQHWLVDKDTHGCLIPMTFVTNVSPRNCHLRIYESPPSVPSPSLVLFDTNTLDSVYMD